MKERSILVILLLSVVALRGDEPLRRIPEDEAKKAVTSKVNPEYPPMARQMRLMGKVQVDALVDVEGSVEKVTIITGNPLLAGAAVNAVKRWKFSPFIIEGKPIRAMVAFTFNFTP